MDPDANLNKQLTLAKLLVDLDIDNLSKSEMVDLLADAAFMAELVLSLNEWIKKGGFLPRIWADAQKR